MKSTTILLSFLIYFSAAFAYSSSGLNENALEEGNALMVFSFPSQPCKIGENVFSFKMFACGNHGDSNCAVAFNVVFAVCFYLNCLDVLKVIVLLEKVNVAF